MAVFMLNICKFNSCGLTFGTLGHLIQHIEETHIDNDPQVLERQERAQPACVPLSYVLRFLTDAARRENALTAVAAQQASKAVSASSLSSSSASSCLSSASYVASGSLSNSQQLQQPQTQHLLLQQQLQQPSQLHAQQQQQQQPPQRMVKTLVPASGISNATAGASDDDEDDADNNEDDDDDDEDDEDIIDCDDDDDDDEEDDEVEDCASNDSWFTTRTNFEHGVEQRQHLQQQHNGHAASSMRYNPVVARNNYQYQQHLQQHQTTKDDSKPFACPVPGCKKRYKNVNGIKYHTKNGHKNDKLLTANFQHQKLQQHLINKASLARNVSNVSSHFHSNANNNSTNKSFKCGCGKSYKTPYGLKNHMAVRHNIVQDHNKSSYHYSQTLVTNNTIPSAIQDHGYIKQQEPQGLECDANLGVLTPAPSPGSLNHHIKYSEMAS